MMLRVKSSGSLKCYSRRLCYSPQWDKLQLCDMSVTHMVEWLQTERCCLGSPVWGRRETTATRSSRRQPASYSSRTGRKRRAAVFRQLHLLSKLGRAATGVADLWHFGTADPYLWLTDPAPDPEFSYVTFKMTTKNYFLRFFASFLFWSFIHIIFQR